MLNRNYLQTITLAIKRSPSGRFLCSAGLFQSLEKSSVPQTTCHQKKEQLRKRAALFLLSAFPVSTRSLPAFVGATASATQTRKKNAGQCLRPPPLMFWRLLYRQPSTSIGTPEKGLNIIICSADASLVRLPLHAPVPTPPTKGAPGPGWLSVTATPPPVQQKTLLASTAFFASLGVFIVVPHNSIAVGLCSFF